MIVHFWLSLTFLLLNSLSLHAQDKSNPYESFLDDRLKMVITPPLIKTFITPIVDCPMEAVIFKKQTTHTSYSSIIMETVKKSGMKGFYNGFWAKVLGTLGKNIYSWPTFTFAPLFFQTYCPQFFKTVYGAQELSSSLAIALFDTFLTPLELIRTLQVTKPNEVNLSYLMRGSIRELYRGAGLHFQYCFASIYSFLMMEKVIRAKTKEITAKPELPWTHFIFIGSTLALIQTSLTTPFMAIRVKLQTETVKSGNVSKRKGYDIFKETVKQNGLRGLYGGWQARLLRCCLTFTFDSFLLDYIDHHTKKEN